MQNKKLIALIILSIIAVFSLIYGTRGSTKKSMLAQKNLSIKESDSSSLARNLAKSSYTSWGSDPFVSRKISTKISHDFILNGIVWDKINPRAIVNDEIVGIGDSIGNITIVDIQKDAVVLNDGTKDFKISIEE